jgi:hypothetical protein
MVRRFNTDKTMWHPEDDIMMTAHGFEEVYPSITWRFTKSVDRKKEQGIQVNHWPTYRCV